MIINHDRVRLVSAIQGEVLEPGDEGTVVYVYECSRAFEVEFITSTGSKVVTVTASQIERVS